MDILGVHGYFVGIFDGHIECSSDAKLLVHNAFVWRGIPGDLTTNFELVKVLLVPEGSQ